MKKSTRLAVDASMALSVASTFTCEPVKKWIEFWMQRCGIETHIQFAAFGQLERELRSPLTFAGAASCVCLLRMADWHRGRSFDATRFEDDFSTFLSSLHTALAHLPRLVVVVCPSRPSADSGSEGIAPAVERMLQLAAAEPRLCVFDALEVATWYDITDMHDPVGDELGHLPFTEAMWCALGAAAVRGSLPALVPPLKLVIVDCDYTLWHHAVGEVGPSAVRCERRHCALHAHLLALRERGVHVALASRNEPANVWSVFERWATDEPIAPRLRRSHVSAYRIAPHLSKAVALDEIARDLQCALESCLFIDDNPSECAAVACALPMVARWCFPQADEEACRQLQHVWRLDLAATTASTEAAARLASVAADEERRELRAGSGSLRAYHEQLQLCIELSDIAEANMGHRPPADSEAAAAAAEAADSSGTLADPSNLSHPSTPTTNPSHPSSADLAEPAARAAPQAERIRELHERTNQFNTWKRPLPPHGALRHPSCEGFVARVTDRYASYGLVGACIGTRQQGTLRAFSFCMSCRVLGRGVEYALLRELGRRAISRDPPCAHVEVGVVPSAHNAPVRRFLTIATRAVDGACIFAASTDQDGVDGVVDGGEGFLRWATEVPQQWFHFPAAQLSSLAFDPEVAAAAEAAEMTAEGEAEGAVDTTDGMTSLSELTREGERSVGWASAAPISAAVAAPVGSASLVHDKASAPHSHEAGSGRNGASADSGQAIGRGNNVQLESLARGLSAMPSEFSSFEQARRARGGSHVPLPFLPRHGATAADALVLLRGVWRQVLELSEAEADALTDTTPFGSLGGDSMLAVSTTSLAARHGLQLAHLRDLNVETMTMSQLVAAGRSWRGERWTRPERQERRLKEARKVCLYMCARLISVAQNRLAHVL